MQVLPRLGGALAILTVAIAPTLSAQRASTVAPATFAITNARIVPVSGPAIERGTLVIRDGIIVAVGATVAIPADARIVAGDSLTIYPGFIDAYGSLGLRAAAAPAGGGGGGGGFGQPAPVAPAGAPNSRNPIGLQPEIRAVDQLVEDADYTAAYGAGITAALTAPAGRVYEGQSALISLNGGDFGAMAIRPTVALHIGFQGIGGGRYPGSLMGVFSALRQSLLDAQTYREAQAAYVRAPRSTARPAYDPSAEALQPVLAGTMPVVFRASTQREIERALDLAKEFRLKPIIAGGSEAYTVIDRLKADNVPLLLSLNFPRVTAAPAADAEPEPLRVLRGRVQAPKTAGQLHAAGVRFALQSGGAAHTEFVANLRRAVTGGLSKDAAIRALTLGSAEILGAADRLGSVEAGKIANLTVVKGDLFADGRVTTVYVDGRPHTVPPPAAPAAGGARGAGGPPRPRSDLEGAWAITVEIDGTERSATLQLRAEDDRLRGSLIGDFGSTEVVDVRIEGEEISFAASLTLSEGTEEAWFRGTLEQGVFTGRVEIIGHETGRFGAFRATSNTSRAREREER